MATQKKQKSQAHATGHSEQIKRRKNQKIQTEQQQRKQHQKG
jgi:hypothetical protein